MPDRELPEDLKARLSAELNSGAPLRAPLAAQARFASTPATTAPRFNLGGRLAVGAGMVAALLLVATLAGAPQSRAWLVQSAGNLVRDVGVPKGAASPSPKAQSPVSSEPGEPSENPSAPEPSHSLDGDETPGAQESPEPSSSPEAHESPEPTHPPDGDGSSGGGSSGGSGDSGGASPSPTPTNDGSGDGSGGGSDDGH